MYIYILIYFSSRSLQLQRQELLGLVVERRAEAAERALELVHGPQLLPQDVHGHGQLRDAERAAVHRGPHEQRRPGQRPHRRQVV